VLAARGLPSQPSQRPEDPGTAGEAWDGNGETSRPAIRPAADQHELTDWDGGTDGTDERPERAAYGTCAVCGDLMAIVEPGQATHPMCEAAP
jgi:hypothetical protein